MEGTLGELARRWESGQKDYAMAQQYRQNVQHQFRQAGFQGASEHTMQDSEKSALAAFGLRPFHVFDGEKYHVCFAVADALRPELKYEPWLVDEFFSNCDRDPVTSNNDQDARQVFDVLASGKAEVPLRTSKAEDKYSPSVSPKEVHYIMEEFYPSKDDDNDDPLGNFFYDENGEVPKAAACERKDITFVMEDNGLSPEEMRLSTCFPSLLRSCSPNVATKVATNGVAQGQTIHLDNKSSSAKIVEALTRTNADRAYDDKAVEPKKKIRAVEDCDAPESIRLDEAFAMTAKARKRRHSLKKGSNDLPQGKPSWSGRDVGDLEEQIGNSWIPEEGPGTSAKARAGYGVSVGQGKRSFWPTPLYCSPGSRLKPPAAQETKNACSPASRLFEEESSDGDEVQESHEQSRKREEVALAKYALLFRDDRSWRKKFRDGIKLTCDICFSKRKVERFSSVMALVSHANSVRKVKLPEHRGYARAIISLLHLEEFGNTPACNSCAGPASYACDMVWPPVVVLENTAMAIGLRGCFIGLSVTDLDQLLRALGDRGKRKVHQVLGENGLTGQALVEFPSSHRGWIDANHLHRQFELQARSYEDWTLLKPKFRSLLADTPEAQESNGLINIRRDNKSLKRILYGYLVTPRLMKHVDPDRKYVDWTTCTSKDVLDTSDSHDH